MAESRAERRARRALMEAVEGSKEEKSSTKSKSSKAAKSKSTKSKAKTKRSDSRRGGDKAPQARSKGSHKDSVSSARIAVDPKSPCSIMKACGGCTALNRPYKKQLAAKTAEITKERIAEIEAAPETILDLGAEKIAVTPADFEITSEDMPGWLVASEGKLTVALDITVTEELRAEGVARELINRIQNIRKDSGFEVTDKIRVEIEQKELVADAVAKYAGYIASQTLAVEVKTAAQPAGGVIVDSDVDDEPVRIAVTRI